jgi:hypothetical protein
MERRIWKRLQREVGVGVFFDILNAAANQMLDGLERSKTRKVTLKESDLFTPDGTLAEPGQSYLRDFAVVTCKNRVSASGR